MNKRIKAVVPAIGIAVAMLLPSAPASALTSDQAALVQIANQFATNAPGSSQAYVSGMAIYGNWALVGWTDNTNSAGEIVASKASGTWMQVRGTGGVYSASELQSLAGVDATSASFLVANFRPLPPVGGPAQDASGALTYDSITERCGTSYDGYTTDDSAPPFIATASISPTTLGQAVTFDLTPATGTAIVTLYGPSNPSPLSTTTIQAGYTGGVGYWNPTAPTGVYSIAVAGTHISTADMSCGGTTVSKRTLTDTSWSAKLAW
jgi:hypothetical protein